MLCIKQENFFFKMRTNMLLLSHFISLCRGTVNESGGYWIWFDG
jgi:hypothetical protein